MEPSNTRPTPYSDHFSIYLQLSGRTITARGEETIELDAGDIGFCDGRRRSSAHGSEAATRSRSVPRAMIERRAPWLRNRPHLKLGRNARFSEKSAAPHDGADGRRRRFQRERNRPSRRQSLQPGRRWRRRRAFRQGGCSRELQMEALLAFCRQNLGNADLSPQQAADHLGISVRTLHSRFRQTDRLSAAGCSTIGSKGVAQRYAIRTSAR